MPLFPGYDSKCFTQLNSKTDALPFGKISNTDTEAFFIAARHSSHVMAETSLRFMLSCPTRSTVSSDGTRAMRSMKRFALARIDSTDSAFSGNMSSVTGLPASPSSSLVFPCQSQSEASRSSSVNSRAESGWKDMIVRAVSAARAKSLEYARSIRMEARRSATFRACSFPSSLNVQGRCD